MHTRLSMAALLGLLLLIGACSSESEEAQPLSIGTSGSDAAFSYYEKSGDLYVDAKEIFEGEATFSGSRITSKSIADQVLAEFDFDGDGRLDNLEFTGLVNAKVLAGTLHHPEWANPSQH